MWFYPSEGQNAMETNLRTLGRQEAKLVLSLREQAQDIVTASEAIAALGSERTARKVIHNLIRKGWLTRLKPGRYMLLPPEHGPENLGESNALALAAAVVEPSYVGWWAAAAFHGFTTQRPTTIAVATLKPLASRTVEGTEVRFVALTPRKFFGFETYDLYGRRVSISTPAKTVVDCVDHPAVAGGPAELARIVFGASSEVEPDDVVRDALAMGSTAVLQRLGFLMDRVGWRYPEALRSQLRQRIAPSARAVLGRPQRRDGDLGYAPEWGLLVHIAERDLLADVPRRQGEP
jgi:predicted transcriptional regulator of viral defense system